MAGTPTWYDAFLQNPLFLKFIQEVRPDATADDLTPQEVHIAQTRVVAATAVLPDENPKSIDGDAAAAVTPTLPTGPAFPPDENSQLEPPQIPVNPVVIPGVSDVTKFGAGELYSFTSSDFRELMRTPESSKTALSVDAPHPAKPPSPISEKRGGGSAASSDSPSIQELYANLPIPKKGELELHPAGILAGMQHGDAQPNASESSAPTSTSGSERQKSEGPLDIVPDAVLPPAQEEVQLHTPEPIKKRKSEARPPKPVAATKEPRRSNRPATMMSRQAKLPPSSKENPIPVDEEATPTPPRKLAKTSKKSGKGIKIEHAAAAPFAKGKEKATGKSKAPMSTLKINLPTSDEAPTEDPDSDMDLRKHFSPRFWSLRRAVPNWLWSIQYLDLSHNQLHGQIPVISDPTGVYNYYDLGQYVYLSSNKFSGQPPRVGKLLVELDLSNNSFSGDLSGFLCNTSASYFLQNLHLGANHLTGELPNCFMNWSSLVALNLGNNNFLGNFLSGDIPLSMHNCTRLVKMDLSDNKLAGNLPRLIVTRLTELVILVLKSNKLSGEITSAICQLSSLQILDLSDNMFSGLIPTCVYHFTAMTTKRNNSGLSYSNFNGGYIESASISTKGMELTYDTILPLVTAIDLSKNNLSGNIPKEITTLVELRTLNLSRNHLTGLIPRSIGNMMQLESLDFSINSLSGDLPNSFTSMSSLNYLNVSCNNLTGRIPESTQLRGFNESSFIGNNLCGPPLTSSCSINDGKAPAGTVRSKDEESNKAEIEWLYVFISLGYAVGLSGFLTTLFLKMSWWEAYCQLFDKIWDDAYVYIHVKWRRVARASGPNM